MGTRVTVAITVLGLLLPGAAFAQGFTQGDKELLLSLNGGSDTDFDSTIFTLQGELGYFFTPNIEGAVRQGIRYNDPIVGESATRATTTVAADYHFDMGRWWPFAGGSLGYIYGSGTSDSWILGIEGGLKYFVNTTTFVAGRVEYQWFLDDGDDGGFDDGQWIYVLGIGFRW